MIFDTDAACPEVVWCENSLAWPEQGSVTSSRPWLYLRALVSSSYEDRWVLNSLGSHPNMRNIYFNPHNEVQLCGRSSRDVWKSLPQVHQGLSHFSSYSETPYPGSRTEKMSQEKDHFLFVLKPLKTSGAMFWEVILVPGCHLCPINVPQGQHPISGAPASYRQPSIILCLG